MRAPSSLARFVNARPASFCLRAPILGKLKSRSAYDFESPASRGKIGNYDCQKIGQIYFQVVTICGAFPHAVARAAAELTMRRVIYVREYK